MGATDHEIRYLLSPLPGGGWLAECVQDMPGGEPFTRRVEYRADWSTDSTGEVAYAQALDSIDNWRRQSPACDRRTDHATRQTLTKLRLCEAKAADYLPPDLMLEMTFAIYGVVDLLLKRLRIGESAP